MPFYFPLINKKHSIPIFKHDRFADLFLGDGLLGDGEWNQFDLRTRINECRFLM